MATFPDGPRIGSTIFLIEVVNQSGRDVLGCAGNGGEDLRIKEGFVNGLMVKTRTENAKRRGALIFTVEHRTREKLLQLLNGGSGDVMGEVGQVGRPQLRAQRLDRRFGHG